MKSTSFAVFCDLFRIAAVETFIYYCSVRLLSADSGSDSVPHQSEYRHDTGHQRSVGKEIVQTGMVPQHGKPHKGDRCNEEDHGRLCPLFATFSGF